MAASDITVSGLNKVGAEDAAYLVSKYVLFRAFRRRASYSAISCRCWLMRARSVF